MDVKAGQGAPICRAAGCLGVRVWRGGSPGISAGDHGGAVLRVRRLRKEGEGPTGGVRRSAGAARSVGARRAGGGRPAAWAVRSWVVGACAGRAGRPSGGGELGPGKEWWAAGLGCWVGLGFWVFWAGFPFQILTLFPISISNKV